MEIDLEVHEYEVDISVNIRRLFTETFFFESLILFDTSRPVSVNGELCGFCSKHMVKSKKNKIKCYAKLFLRKKTKMDTRQFGSIYLSEHATRIVK